MTTANTIPSIPLAANLSVAGPTQAQIDRLVRMGQTVIPTTRSEASKMISGLIAASDMQTATQAQCGRAGVLGGRDLPGAGRREKSTQIAILEALVAFDQAESDEASSAAINILLERVRERFVRPNAVVKVTANIVPPAAPAAEAEEAPF